MLPADNFVDAESLKALQNSNGCGNLTGKDLEIRRCKRVSCRKIIVKYLRAHAATLESVKMYV